MSGKPSIPDRHELLCHYCRQHRRRDQIVEAKRIKNGRQTVYRCQFCADRLNRIKASGK